MNSGARPGDHSGEPRSDGHHASSNDRHQYGRRPRHLAQEGRITVSMTWMTPLVHSMSVLMTLASSIDHGAVLDGDLGLLALDGLDVVAVELDHVGGHRLAGDDVVLEDGDELLLVLRLEQGLDGTLGQLGEGLVGRGQHGERALALERVDQVGGLEGGGQRLERTGADRGVDDVLLVVGEGRNHEREGGNQSQNMRMSELPDL